METEIKITAILNDEQLDVLIQEIKNTAEMIGVKLEVESNELSHHDVGGQNELLLAFGKFIDEDCGLLGEGYIQEMVKQFQVSNIH